MCTSPCRVYKTGLKTETGKDLLYFDAHYPSPGIISLDLAERKLKRFIPPNPDYVKVINGKPYLYNSTLVPCGHCDDDLLHTAKVWAHRCLMESKSSPDNWFVTLTFMDACLPKYVCKRDVSDFVKRLRKRLGPNIRFFACGEYGEKGDRPHYHLILFNCPLKDLRLADATRNLYEFKVINECWPFGMSRIGEVTQKSCAYVARYTSKKSGKKKGFLLMSRMPGIGRRYMEECSKVALEFDYLPVMVNDKMQRITPPRYFERIHPGHDFTRAKQARVWNAQRSLGLKSFFHGLIGCSLDDYLRRVSAVKADRLRKVEI